MGQKKVIVAGLRGCFVSAKIAGKRNHPLYPPETHVFASGNRWLEDYRPIVRDFFGVEFWANNGFTMFHRPVNPPVNFQVLQICDWKDRFQKWFETFGLVNVSAFYPKFIWKASTVKSITQHWPVLPFKFCDVCSRRRRDTKLWFLSWKETMTAYHEDGDSMWEGNISLNLCRKRRFRNVWLPFFKIWEVF